LPPVLVELGDLPEAQREAEAERQAIEEARRPFDLARGPLVRARVLRLADDEHAVILTMHHIVTDGWSMGIAARELASLYGAFVEGRPSPLPALPLQYADYAVWQKQWIDGDVRERLLGYWTRRLEGL